MKRIYDRALTIEIVWHFLSSYRLERKYCLWSRNGEWVPNNIRTISVVPYLCDSSNPPPPRNVMTFDVVFLLWLYCVVLGGKTFVFPIHLRCFSCFCCFSSFAFLFNIWNSFTQEDFESIIDFRLVLGIKLSFICNQFHFMSLAAGRRPSLSL